MWLADNWEDFEVIDASSGEKLERWKDFILLRPDPQVIWNTDKTEKAWKNINARYHRSSKGGGEWEFINLPEQWRVSYRLKGIDELLVFNLKPFSFKHTGLFPEQAVNWEWFTKLIADRIKNTDDGVKVLNLFAYTGGATVAAVKAGAHVTHVDASKGMVGWAKENAKSSAVDETKTRWIVDDCRKFVEREIRRGNSYDAVIMDPPSYGRGPKGEIWKIEDQVYDLIKITKDILNEKPLFFLINSYTTGLQPAVLSYMLNTVIAKDKGGIVCADEIGLPVRSTGLALPCGASGRWQAK